MSPCRGSATARNTAPRTQGKEIRPQPARQDAAQSRVRAAGPAICGLFSLPGVVKRSTPFPARPESLESPAILPLIGTAPEAICPTGEEQSPPAGDRWDWNIPGWVGREPHKRSAEKAPQDSALEKEGGP